MQKGPVCSPKYSANRNRAVAGWSVGEGRWRERKGSGTGGATLGRANFDEALIRLCIDFSSFASRRKVTFFNLVRER
jgi:hypothetical protein